MNAQEIRQKYLDFLKKKNHQIIPPAPLLPLNDPTTLFTGSGMQPLIPYLLGEPHPEGSRLANSQPCLRSQDIDEVGDNRHTTFFEMLGNWSLGDYFKLEQIKNFWEFLTEEIKLDPDRIYVSCFSGNEQVGIPKDYESAEIWKVLFADKGIDAKEVELGSEENGAKVGESGGRIFFYGDKNWWCRSGKAETMPVGEPGGPDSEVFYIYPDVPHDKTYGEKCHINCDCGRYIELGNSVFMEYIKTVDGFDKLPKQNVDFGGGLERIAAAAINSPDVYLTSLLHPIIQELQNLSGKHYDSHQESMRVIADHFRGAVFLAGNGVEPSNKEQGYVMRRLMRRAIRFAFELGIEQEMCSKIAKIVIKIYQEAYPELKKSEANIVEVLVREEKIFRETLKKGLREFSKRASGGLSGDDLFMLHDTYGFPMELSLEEAYKQGIELEKDWRNVFDKAMQKQRDRSRTAGQGVFKGGLADHSVETTRLHTAHHLLLRALKDVLGDHVVQRGSNITAERLRIDFAHPEKVTREQLGQVELIVNDKINQDLPVIRSEMPLAQAEKLQAEHEFGAKYPDVVSVYSIGPATASQTEPKLEQAYSIEFCGGPHVGRTGELATDGRKFQIRKEEASSSGVRRIKAILS